MSNDARFATVMLTGLAIDSAGYLAVSESNAIWIFICHLAFVIGIVAGAWAFHRGSEH